MEREQLTATVRAAQQGDEKALNLLFNTYYNDVYYFALKTLKDEDLACDITQETFVEIINTLQDLKEPAAFVTWMRQVTYHQCTRYFKKKKEVLVEEDEDGNSVFDTLEEEREEFIPGEGVDKEDFRATILALLDTLSEEQRAAVLMHYYHEMSVKDIAEAQQVSEGTVKSRLNYARKSLKKSVEDYEKKHDVKLHCAGVLPLLLWLFASAGEEVMPVAAAKTVAGGVATATSVHLALSAGGGVATVTATTAAGTGLMAKIAALPVAVKIISGITAGALLIGSVAVASDKMGKSPEPTNPAVMQTEPSGDNNPGDNDETTMPSGLVETQPDPMKPDSTQPTDPEQPDSSKPSEDPKEPEKPFEPEVKNEFFNDKNYEMVEGEISVKPRRAYWKDGQLVMECFVINGLSYILNWVQVTDITVETPDGQVIAKSYFDYFREDQIRYGNYYIHTFTFPKECVKIPNASLQSLNLKYGLSWNDIDNRYDNQEIAHYPLNEGRLPNSDPAVAQKKVDVRIRWAYWDGNDMKLRLSIANGTDVAITDVSVNSLMMTNTSGLITSTSFGILKDGNGAAVTVEPGRYVDVDATIVGKGTNHELINAQWSILFSNKNLLPAAPDASFDGVTDEQILASLENCRAGRMPMNDDPRYTYMSETRVVGTLIDCEYDIAAVEVLYATINGAPCTVYQTHNPKKIKEILDSEEWDAETFGCREILNIFLIESDEPIEVMDNRTDYVIVEHHIMFRVYLTNGEYRDVLYGSDNYILEIFGGGMMSRPEWYE